MLTIKTETMLSNQATSFAPLFKTSIESGIDFSKLRDHLRIGLERMLAHPKFQRSAHLWLSGSGDSLFAAEAVLPGLRRWAGIEGTALSGIEFARYRAPLLTAHDALWAISNSGSAARTRETVSLAQSMGVLAVGITGSESGPLASSADTYVFRPVVDLPEINETNRGIFMNMNEFLVTLYSLYCIGLHIGVANGALTESAAESILTRCERAIHLLPALAAAHEEQAAKLAEQLKDLDTIWMIGAGPSHGTARYCAAKFHEQLPWNGIPEDLEEWAHLQYFLSLEWKERSVVMVLAPPGNSMDRAEELVEGISGVGGRAIVVGHPDHGVFTKAMMEFRLADTGDEFLSAFTYHLPAQMLILHLARQRGHEPFALRRADGYQLIRHGVVRNDARKLD
jgi:glucosamine--fructose-6-phosphate aminotransferase (isomerizing)